MTLEALSQISTGFILASGASLLSGWYFIRAGRQVGRHRTAMLSATALAAAFLVFYVTRWSLFGSKHFGGTGVWKAVYLGILFPHVLLAIAVGPMAARLIYLAAVRQDFAAHRRLARVTLPVWLFVSASGWVIYYMLYSGVW
jgi:putative membrane protein